MLLVPYLCTQDTIVPATRIQASGATGVRRRATTRGFGFPLKCARYVANGKPVSYCLKSVACPPLHKQKKGGGPAVAKKIAKSSKPPPPPEEAAAAKATEAKSDNNSCRAAVNGKNGSQKKAMDSQSTMFLSLL